MPLGGMLLAATLLATLGAPSLQRTTASGDSLAAPAACRIIARMNAALAFYEPRARLARGEAQDALVMLAAAAQLAPLEGESCTLLSRAQALAPQSNAELHCAADGGSSSEQ